MVTRQEAIAALTAPGEPYELGEAELYGHQRRVFLNAPPTLRDLYHDTRSDLDFFVYEDERLTFEEGWQEACAIADLLVNECGVQKGDRVAIAMRNYPEWATAFMAVTSVGGIAVAVNSHWQPNELEHALNDCRPRVILADRERLERLQQCTNISPDLQIFSVRAGDTSSGRDLREALAGRTVTEMPDIPLDPNDDATMFYTSGSTGFPKGVLCCHRNVISALMSWELDGHAGIAMGILEMPDPEGPQPVTLLGVPLFHVTGSHAVFLMSFRAQRRIVSMYKWSAEKAAELVEKERVTALVAAPAMTGDMVEVAKTTGHDLSSLKTVGGGGAPRAPEQVRNIDRTFKGAKPNTGWGMTETNAIGTTIAGAPYLERPESSGQCSAVLELRVVDENGTELPQGARGELQIRGTSLFKGYWERPEANAESFEGDWFRTGDVAYLDEEGFLFIVDRIKDLVIRGGENIGCGAVEAALQEHPDIIEASVYGVPDERLGEEVGTTIYATAAVGEDQLKSFLGSKLAKFEIPRFYQFTDQPLTRGATGKILKREIRAEALKQLNLS